MPLKKWTIETDLNYTCSGDDEHAARLNFTNCPIKDYRPLIKRLITESGLSFLVYSGDVDAQIPHTATEAWTSGLGIPVKREWQPWTEADDSGRRPSRAWLCDRIRPQLHFRHGQGCTLPSSAIPSIALLAPLPSPLSSAPVNDQGDNRSRPFDRRPRSRWCGGTGPAEPLATAPPMNAQERVVLLLGS